MKKALGADIMEFYDHHWPEGYYHDDNSLAFHDENAPGPDDVWLLDPTKKYDLRECGVLVKEGDISEVLDFEEVFTRWMKARKVTTVVLEIPTDVDAWVRETLAARGCRIIA